MLNVAPEAYALSAPPQILNGAGYLAAGTCKAHEMLLCRH